MVSSAPRPLCLHLGDDPTTPGWRAAGERDGVFFPVSPESGTIPDTVTTQALSVQGMGRMQRKRVITDCPPKSRIPNWGRGRGGRARVSLKPEEDSSQMNKRVGDLTWRLETQQALLDSHSCPLLAGDTQQTTTGMKRPGQRPPRPQTDGMMAWAYSLTFWASISSRKQRGNGFLVLTIYCLLIQGSNQAENIDLRSIEKTRVE